MSGSEPETLAGKTILIVGGTSGLGRSATRICLRKGANVVSIGRTEESCEELLREVINSDRLRVVAGDAAESSTATKGVEEAVREFGSLDGLYHVAGGSGRRWGDGPLHEITDEGWQQTVALNMDSLFYSNRAVASQLIKQGTGGSILNMVSVLAYSPSPQHFATHTYASTKAGAIGLTVAAASYYAKQGIRFNALAPALVDTKLTERAKANDEIMEYVHDKQPLDGGRIGEVEDLDAAVVYFLSDESRFVTGQVLAIDGGWSVS